jgi:hypothetical protein
LPALTENALWRLWPTGPHFIPLLRIFFEIIP